MVHKKRMIIWAVILFTMAGTTGLAKYSYESQKVVQTITTIYSQGSRGEVVRTIQDKLKRWGYFDGAVDGVYGPQTTVAIRNFQQSNGLNPDGIAGTVTLEALGIFLDDKGTTSENATDNELRILASAIHGEGRGEPYEGQVAIGAVILNRVESPNFPNTIAGVVYQSGAFDAVKDGQINLTPNDSAYKAAQDALNGWDPSEGALYYWNPVTATSRWIWSVPITKQIGRHVFGTK